MAPLWKGVCFKKHVMYRRIPSHHKTLSKSSVSKIKSLIFCCSYFGTSTFVNSFQMSMDTRLVMDLICLFGPSSYNFVFPSLTKFFKVVSYRTGETSCLVSISINVSLSASEPAIRVPRTFMKIGTSGFLISIVSKTALRFCAAESILDV